MITKLRLYDTYEKAKNAFYFAVRRYKAIEGCSFKEMKINFTKLQIELISPTYSITERFDYISDESDCYKFGGVSLTHIVFDEASEFTDRSCLYMLSRVKFPEHFLDRMTE